MSHSFSLLLYHVVFSTQYRVPVISPPLREELYPYLEGMVRDQRGDLLAVGGMPDHVHLLVRLRPTMPVSKLLQLLKANSSRWVHERLHCGFAWQEGYGAFTVSESGAAAVCRYIQNQESRHRRRSYEEELIALLTKHRIQYDPAHLFD
jgi:putative transposase